MESVQVAQPFEVISKDVPVEDYPESSSSEDEIEEVKVELEGLKADAIYHEFVENVSLNRDVKEDDPSDAEFVLQDELNKIGKTEEEAHLSSSSSSESDYEEALEEAEEAVEVEQKIEVPPDMLKEASARFPPFWRTKYHLGRITDNDDKNEVDPDYVPPEEELDIPMDQQPREVATEEMLSDDENDADTSSVSSESSDDEEVADGNLDGDNLVEMLEDLAIPDDKAEASGDSSQVVEQVCLVHSIVEFDENGYKSEEDPDFIPTEDVANIGEVSSSDSSDSEEDNECEHSDEGMEQ